MKRKHPSLVSITQPPFLLTGVGTISCQALKKRTPLLFHFSGFGLKKKINSQELSPFLYLPTHLISLSAMEEGYLICLNVCVHRDLQRGNLNPTCLFCSFLKHSSSQHVSFRSTHLSISLNTNLEQLHKSFQTLDVIMNETVIEMKKVIISVTVSGEWYNRGRGRMLQKEVGQDEGGMGG